MEKVTVLESEKASTGAANNELDTNNSAEMTELARKQPSRIRGHAWKDRAQSSHRGETERETKPADFF